MEALNSTSGRKTAPAQHMRSLEKAVFEADSRIRMRRVGATNAQLFLTVGFAIPFCSYLIYNFFAAGGVMQNYKTSSGAYMNYAMTWMLKPRSATSIYRPEIEMAQQSMPLVAYTRKIEAQRADGSVPEGVHHPTSWH
uniref:Uncharacterized protein n=1 Tax=Favella ehrenbergii TaxID=182087 RepID=A0A7S3HY61_9SPIT|mmetsp:Transcript_17394/g.21968  ORF Transcript_17394/g.21968 Transcript_17394/m.21968 type:complete len:138 (+) Transcript_17394:32-445(+)|eukprot:CAMPEP_0170458136 /NCGR_PEP_ID=MMETSP0123-20130129/5196_1 /TAXON_ID=182087 /ORGANISM="Favella ehrenbergii, Strain Fehren 1" /LENGTH=137 /DNA_ID=CAMNT_0010722163 /DNA_START=14 /DNA_END=427 /DNA_ORIENTATION=+